MIYVCDAIMGAGKTQSAITYMNEHPDKKFVYITPFLPETERIANDCSALRFRLPSDKIREFHFSKVEHTRQLLLEGRNIATTHSSFKLYKPDMAEAIKAGGYTLIIDEAVSMLSEVPATPCDVQLFHDAGFLESTDRGTLRYTGKEYCEDGMLHDLYKLIQYNEVFRLTEKADDGMPADMDDMFFYWETSPDSLMAFEDVFVLTYLFDSYDMRNYLEMQKAEYTYIGVSKDEDGTYRFSDKMDYYPSYIGELDKMVRIWDHPRMNSIGDQKFSLSKNWLKKNTDGVDQLKKNMRVFFSYHFSHVPAKDALWSTFKEFEPAMRPKGYAKEFLPCNTRAVNGYRNCTILAYCVNLFINPFLKRYLAKSGITPDDDLYALSIMIQWIWRSAIRDGKPIDIYIPSKRMRTILQEWIADTQAAYHAHQKGGELCA